MNLDEQQLSPNRASSKNQTRVAEIKRDFLGGSKTERVKELHADDCR